MDFTTGLPVPPPSTTDCGKTLRRCPRWARRQAAARIASCLSGDFSGKPAVPFRACLRRLQPPEGGLPAGVVMNRSIFSVCRRCRPTVIAAAAALALMCLRGAVPAAAAPAESVKTPMEQEQEKLTGYFKAMADAYGL